MASLMLVPPPEPPEELVQQKLDRIVLEELSLFADNLELARGMWRTYRVLVEAPEFPEHLRAAIRAIEGRQPDDHDGEWTPDPDEVRNRPESIEQARKLAREEMEVR